MSSAHVSWLVYLERLSVLFSDAMVLFEDAWPILFIISFVLWGCFEDGDGIRRHPI